jgi:hypothetical protein
MIVTVEDDCVNSELPLRCIMFTQTTVRKHPSKPRNASKASAGDLLLFARISRLGRTRQIAFTGDFRISPSAFKPGVEVCMPWSSKIEAVVVSADVFLIHA